MKFFIGKRQTLNNALPFLLICLSFLWAFPAAAADWAEIRWVADGDTVVLTDGKLLRYIGINAPEIEHESQKAEPFGYEARSFNKKLVLDQRLRLEFDKEVKDRFGRALAYVFLTDGTLVNQVLLERGYAYFLFKKPNLRYADTLLLAQRDAMEFRRGIWKNWEEIAEKYLGNQKSKRFHLPDCPYGKRMGKKNRVFFSTSWDAFFQGYAPCKRCLNFESLRGVDKR